MRKLAAALFAGILCAGLLVGCAVSPETHDSSSTASSTSAQEPPISDIPGSSSSIIASKKAKHSSTTQATVPAALKTAVKQKIDASSVDASFAYVDLKTGASYMVGENTPMVSASVIKLLILAAFLDQVDQGTLGLDDTYTLKSSDIVGGTGSLQGRGAGTQVTLREAAQLMITESDNVGANILIDQVGMKNINAEAEALGLTGAQLNRRMMETNGQQNYLSARDTSIILKKIYAGTLVNKKMSALALDFLKGQKDSTGFAQGLSGSAVFAHKTGTLGDPVVQNDAGIVLADDPYILVCFTSGSHEAGAALMADLARAVEANR